MSGEAERLKKKFDLLKALDEKHEIGRLRLRADVAECVRDCYNSGMTRADVSRLLDLSPTRVTALVQGNWKAGAASVKRSKTNYQLAWIEPPEPEIVFVDRPTEAQQEARKEAVCLYCSEKAEFVVQWENKEVYVCTAHKPQEVEQ